MRRELHAETETDAAAGDLALPPEVAQMEIAVLLVEGKASAFRRSAFGELIEGAAGAPRTLDEADVSMPANEPRDDRLTASKRDRPNIHCLRTAPLLRVLIRYPATTGCRRAILTKW